MKVDYSLGKIYKIECLGGEPDDIYIGSTCEKYLSKRFNGHKKHYRSWKTNGICHKMTSFDIFDKYGVENCVIVLLENVNCATKTELYAREAFFIRSTSCVNKHIPLRTHKEYKKDNEIKIIARRKSYFDEDPEKVRASSRNSKLKHKNEINAKRNKSTLCICGLHYTPAHNARHLKSPKHIAWQNKVDELIAVKTIKASFELHENSTSAKYIALIKNNII